MSAPQEWRAADDGSCNIYGPDAWLVCYGCEGKVCTPSRTVRDRVLNLLNAPRAAEPTAALMEALEKWDDCTTIGTRITLMAAYRTWKSSPQEWRAAELEVLAAVRVWRSVRGDSERGWPTADNLIAKHDALAALDAPPAPRYVAAHVDYVSGTFPWAVLDGTEPKGGLAVGYFRNEADARAHASVLNARVKP